MELDALRLTGILRCDNYNSECEVLKSMDASVWDSIVLPQLLNSCFKTL